MKLVEECSGVGAMHWQEQTLGRVPYRISRFQGLSGSGMPIPGLHRIEGVIELREVAGQRAPHRLELHARARGRPLAERSRSPTTRAACSPKATGRSTAALAAEGDPRRRCLMNVTAADFQRDYDAIRGVRFAVFVDEQRIDPDIEMDDRDAQCEHVLAWDARGEAVGTGRIDFGAGGKVGRVAVLARARRTGVGTALMESLHELARSARHRGRLVQRAGLGRPVLRRARLSNRRRSIRRGRHRPRPDGAGALSRRGGALRSRQHATRPRESHRV